jgi:gamma-glutamyl-gamma-aminobutyrate hydrolase PuuD
MKNFKIYCSDGQTGYANWLLGTKKHNTEFQATLTYNMREADILILTGGADISTEMYGEKDTQNSIKNTKRDIEELILAGYAIKHNIPILGICRGAQMLCAIAGGKLVQNISHNHEHEIVIFNNKYYECPRNRMLVNSLHHQLQYPFNIKDKHEYVMIAATYTDLRMIDTGGSKDISLKTLKRKGEPEIVYYKKIKGLGIQFHPEMLYACNKENPIIEFLHSCIKKTILDGRV